MLILAQIMVVLVITKIEDYVTTQNMKTICCTVKSIRSLTDYNLLFHVFKMLNVVCFYLEITIYIIIDITCSVVSF